MVYITVEDIISMVELGINPRSVLNPKEKVPLFEVSGHGLMILANECEKRGNKTARISGHLFEAATKLQEEDRKATKSKKNNKKGKGRR